MKITTFQIAKLHWVPSTINEEGPSQTYNNVRDKAKILQVSRKKKTGFTIAADFSTEPWKQVGNGKLPSNI